MCVPHSGCSPTHSSLGWPPLNPSPVRCCCLAAGLNTAHCVSAPSQPQTVPTNVLLIRWLNYSCKNNVDISLKIAVCQILLANVGLQPLLSNSPSDPPRLSLPLAPPTFSSPLWFFLSPSHFLPSFMSQAATQANSERPNTPQISLTLMQPGTSWKPNTLNTNVLEKHDNKSRKERKIKENPSTSADQV